MTNLARYALGMASAIALALVPATAGAQFGMSSFMRAPGPKPRLTTASPLSTLADKVREGEQLFRRHWRQEGKLPNSDGDGIGPMFNAFSCLECHQSGAPGGAAAAEKNVNLLSLLVSPGQLRSETFEERVAKIHPGFNGEQTTVVLHHRGLNEKGRTGDYDVWRAQLLRIGERDALTRANPLGVRNGFKVRLSQRNTPALFGDGLIDAIPDHVLVAIADEEKKDHPEIAGRIARDAAGGVGRFGWRGQIGHLHEFVLGACANELGLHVPNHPQPEWIEVKQEEGIGRSATFRESKLFGHGFDLTNDQCLSLTSFVAALLPPTQSASASVEHARNITAGERLFGEIGCADCHRPAIASIHGIYSDLLLHDMGGELADPAAANPDSGSEFGEPSSAYFGNFSSLALREAAAGRTTNVKQEWRTPPLWGVGDSAPYLHDGRAATLPDAVLLHGGQGRRSARRFAALSKPDRERLLDFLASLAAPRVDGLAPGAVQVSDVVPPFGPTPSLSTIGVGLGSPRP